MNRMQEQVRLFHQATGATIGEGPAIRDPELRAELIREEADETIRAIQGGDLAGAIDGLCDLLYVVFGAAITFGVDLEPFFDEVQRANMTKIGGPVREDGKRLKPDGWTAPRIRELLAAMGSKMTNDE